MRRQRENRITQLELFSVGRIAWGAPIFSEPAHDGVGALDGVTGTLLAAQRQLHLATPNFHTLMRIW
jgi:hypothetical protein